MFEYLKEKRVAVVIMVVLAVFLLVVWGLGKFPETAPGSNVASKQEAPYVVPAPSANLTGEFKVGAFLPLSGKDSANGETIKRSLDLATEQINSANGVAGKKLVLEYVDGDCASSDGVQKMIVDNGVSFVIVGPCPADAKLKGVADKNKTIVFSFGSLADAALHAPDFLFDLVANENFGIEASIAGRYVATTLGGKRVAAVSASDAASIAVKKAFMDAVRKNGGTIVNDETFKAGSGSSAWLDRTRSSKPDVAFVFAVDDTLKGTLLDELARTATYKLVTVGGPATDPESRNQAFPEGTVTVIEAFVTGDERVTDFTKTFTGKYGSAPTDLELSAIADAAPYLIRDLVQKDGEDTTSIQKTLSTLVNGWSGGAIASLTFDKNGDAVPSRFVIMGTSEGVQTALETVSR